MTCTRTAIALTLVTAATAHATPLDDVALFRKCYGLITQTFVPPDHALLAQVKGGTLEPITACLTVLDKGRLAATGQLALSTDAEARRVLNAFHALHYSWFSVRDFDTDLPDSVRDSTRDLYDISSPALYFTEAAFGAGSTFREVMTGTTTYGAVRTTMNPPTGVFTGVSNANWIYTGATLQTAPTGDLLGVRSMAPTVVTQGARNTSIYGASLTLFRHFGSGMLGSSPYVTFTVRQSAALRSNAGVIMPRKWALAVFKDLLCREAPMIRTADARPYVVPTASIAFRQAATCVRCHASLDQLAATARHVGLTNYESGYANPVATRVLNGSLATVHKDLNQTPEAAWPVASDSSYYRRPATGRLVMRTFDGTLIDRPLASLSELGTALGALDDPYVCAALRYWQYFVGTHLAVTDLGDPELETGQAFSPAEQRHWARVVALGRGLKTHQSVRTMLEQLLRSPGFRDPAVVTEGTP